MKKGDLLFLCVTLVLFVPFFVSDELYGAYREFNSSHGMLASFFKFAVLSTLGELLGLRISSGSYYRKGFGVIPRAFVWGIFGMAINMAFVINKKINLGDNVTTISKNFTSFVKNYIEEINKSERQEP